MRRQRNRHIVLVLALGAAGAMGCIDLLADRTLFREGPDATSGGGGAGGAGGTGGNGGTGGAPPSCVPASNSQAVDDSCGVFVSSSMGADTGDGSKDKPFATIAKALEAGKGKPVFLCGETFAEAVTLTDNAQLFGALDCAAGWAYSADKRSVIAPAADMVPLRVGSKIAVDVQDVNLTAADATAPGGSSMAMIAEGEADVGLARSDLTAGNGAPGADGAAFGMAAAAGGDGLVGADACTAVTTIGGASVKNTCGAEESLSGLGGIGSEANGGDGSDGTPLGTANGGSGESGSACANGGPGDPGGDGPAGAGASGLGSLSKDGFIGVAGGDGQSGKVGQGGGGGGGAKGGASMGNTCNKVMNAPGNAGASGGSGGAGGCGGAGGKGGQAGGASIGIVSLGASLLFADVTITVKDGGKGGAGGPGQAGGDGGMGGAGGMVPAAASSLKAGCTGGVGGKGGAGGKGGGGLGGHSIGIAHNGAEPAMEGVQINIGNPGTGGAGDAGSDGAAGVSAKVQKL